jgi:hypothetical protein
MPGRFHVSRVLVGENEHVVHDILLGTGRIHGRVTDRETAEPLTEVQVVVQMSRLEAERTDLRKRAAFSLVSARLVPDEDGRYAFANLPEGEYVLFSNGKEHSPQRKEATLGPAGGEARVDFELERGSAVDIAILDLEGNPVRTPLWMAAGIRCGFTGHVVGLRAGKHDFAAFGIGYEAQVRPEVEFRPGETTELAFRLAPEAATRLVFEDPEGRPLEGVRVFLPRDGRDLLDWLTTFLREQNIPLRTTDAEGIVHIRGVRAGPVRVVAKRSGFALLDRTIELSPDQPDVRVALERADATFAFRVRVASVMPEGAADALGLRPGDVLLSYDGVAVDSAAALARAIEAAGRNGGARVPLVLRREGAEVRLSAPPGVLGIGLEEFEE